MRADAVACGCIGPHRSASRRIPHAVWVRNSFGREDPGRFARVLMPWQVLSDKQCSQIRPDPPGCGRKHSVKFIFAWITSLYGRNRVHPAASRNDSSRVPVYSTESCILSNGAPQNLPYRLVLGRFYFSLVSYLYYSV